MLSKETFKTELRKCFILFDTNGEKTKAKLPIWYNQCKYLTDEVFTIGIQNLIDTFNDFTTSNLLKSLPQYKRIEAPKSIEEYCKKYLYKSYNKDKMIEFLETEHFTEKEKDFINKLKIEMEDDFYEIKPYTLKEKFKYNIDNIIKAIRREKEKPTGWEVDLVETFAKYSSYEEHYYANKKA